MVKISNNWKPLVDFFDEMIRNTVTPKWNKSTINKAKLLRAFLTNKHVLSLLHFNLDVQKLFSVQSQKFQRKLESIIGKGATQFIYQLTLFEEFWALHKLRKMH